jgi:serine/threonine protein kinase
VASTATLLGGRYRLDGLIARGGMADVHRATDTRLERPVAVKVLRDAGETSRFDAEVHTLAGLRHPGIVSLLDAGTTADGTRFLVLELRTEPTLAAVIAAGPLPPERVAAIATGLADALAYLHARGVVHRDVKPANVFVDEHDATRLTDFGIARVAGAASLTATGFTMGTARYLAPEQLDGGEVTPAVDVYALGLVMIECLSARPAFAGTNAEVASARLVRDPELPPTVPARWRPLLQSMTTRHPSLRPDAARAAVELAALNAPVRGGPPTRTMPLPVAQPGHGRLRRNLIALGALALATFAAVAALMSAGGGSSGGNVGPGVTTPTIVASVPTTTPVVAESTPSTEAVTAVTPTSVPHRRGGQGHGNGDRGGGNNGGGD